MAYITSIGLGIPSISMKQTEIKSLVKEIFVNKRSSLHHLLGIFDNAKINERQFTAKQSWYKEEHTFSERNEIYHRSALQLSLDAIDHCLHANEFLNKTIPYEAIDMIVFVSSTGISTPSMETYIMNERPFKPSIVRMPLWGLGCAGGAIGMSRAFEWLQHNKTKITLVVCCELCSLTFQKDDYSTSNIVGTALFGDGVAATLLIGEASPYLTYCKNEKLKITSTSSWTEKNTTNIMGWELTNSGLQVIFSKQIPALVEILWKKHVMNFLDEQGVSIEEIATFIAHPGGRKVLEEMERSFSLNRHIFRHSYDVLSQHGNMSSATVLYVLKNKLLEGNISESKNSKEIICALGPGFSSELLLAEWVNE